MTNPSRASKDKSTTLVVIIDNARLAPPTHQRKMSKGDERDMQIVHQCMLMLFDSPMNHVGLLQVYIRTTNKLLIHVHREMRIPRTLKRFSHLMTSLLVDRNLPSVPTKDGSIQLMRVINGPIERHLSPRSKSFQVVSQPYCEINESSKIVKDITEQFQVGPTVQELPKPAVIYVSTLSAKFYPKDNSDEQNGDLKNDKIKNMEHVSLSLYPLTPEMICARITSAFEARWGIL